MAPGRGPARFGVVGSGWRGEFFVRMARLMPERFECAGVVTRSSSRAEQIGATWGVPAVQTLDELVSARPEFVVVAVPWPQTPEVTRALVAAGVPVLAETPPAPDADGLRSLWSDVGASGLVQVAEHSPSMPAHAARIAVVESGAIGVPTSVQISSTHLYHAVGLIRRLLGVAPGVTRVRATRLVGPLLDPLARDGWTGATAPAPAGTTLATLDFGDGRGALYDFTDNQWHNPLRTNRIVVRGSHGEIVDDAVTRWVDPTTVLTSRLERRVSGLEQNLDGFDLEHLSFDGRVVYRNDFHGARLADDDLAVAELLRATAAWVRDEGPAPYPLAEGSEDHLIGLAIDEAVSSAGEVVAGPAPWA